ncbi:MAG: HNH endonuclease [Acidimicrobiia bacterium]|nr:HNH endonuclease [Acidimicrobiia bacterium]
MKTPTPTTGGVFGEDASAKVLAEELADRYNRISDDDLEASIVELKQHIDAQHADLLLRVAEYHRRDLGQLRHFLSTVGWVKQALRLTSAAASSMVRSARSLVAMPLVADSASLGRITPEGVRLLVHARRRHPDEFSVHEEVFADIAQYLDTKDLRRAIEHWEQQIDYPSALAKVKAQYHRRRFSMAQTWDGMWHLSGELDPETGSLVDTAIRSIADRENLAASREDSTDTRYPWQRRADALGDLCSFWLSNSDKIGTSGGSKPTLIVTAGIESILGLKKELPSIDGLVFDPDEMRRIICDSAVVRIILDSEGEPLNVGRQSRTVTPAIRRALDLRDGGCIWNGCDAPPSWCDAHHLIHWVDGGETSLTNMVLLCRRHHRAAHEQSGDPPGEVPP